MPKPVVGLDVSAEYGSRGFERRGWCALRVALRTCSSLQRLALRGQSAVDLRDVSLPELRVLDVGECDLSGEAAFADAFPKLQHLNAGHNIDLEAVVSLPAGLETLDLTWCSTVEAVPGLAACSRLRELRLLKMASLERLDMPPSTFLTVLTLTVCGPGSLPPLPPSLTQLDMTDSNTVPEMADCPPLPLLEALDFTWSRDVPLPDRLAEFTALTELRLSNHGGGTPLPLPPNLERLSLGQHYGLSALPRLERLRALHMNGHQGSLAALHELDLDELRLVNCTGAYHVDWAALAGRLRVLDLSGVEGITPLLPRMEKLEVLSLVSCELSQLPDVSVLFPSLRHLDVHDNPHLEVPPPFAAAWVEEVALDDYTIAVEEVFPGARVDVHVRDNF